ncbi:MAG: response regulator transcription factor [Myxococcales bacterium]|nr:response regulator transcription factor [Myxococcales bacterium]
MADPATSSGDPEAPRRVVVVDDHPLIRRALGDLIARDPTLSLSGEAANADEALRLVGDVQPDLVVLDISMPGGDGTALIARLVGLHPALAILVLSMHDEALYAERVLRAGARGYVMKHESPQEVMRAIERVLSGRVHLSDSMTERVLERSAAPSSVGQSIAALSDRELQVLRLMGEGRGTAQIAESLGLSTKTVDTYRSNLKRKLALKSHAELMRYAMHWMDAPRR